MKLLHFGGPSLDVSRARARGLLFDEWPVLVDVQPKQAGEDHGRPFMWSGDGYLPDQIRTRVRSVGEQIDYGPASGHGASMPRSSAAFWLFIASPMSLRTIAVLNVGLSCGNRPKLAHVGASSISSSARLRS